MLLLCLVLSKKEQVFILNIDSIAVLLNKIIIAVVKDSFDVKQSQ